MDKEHFSIPRSLAPVVIGCLLWALSVVSSAAVFFLVKAFDKLESLEHIAIQSRQDIAVIQAMQDTQIKKSIKGE